jgi:hypothetical protein
MEQAAEAAEQAATAGLAARLAAAIGFAAAAGFATARGLSGTRGFGRAAARLSGTGRFATAARLFAAAARLAAAVVVAVEQAAEAAEHAATAGLAARFATTIGFTAAAGFAAASRFAAATAMTAEEGRGARSAAENNGDAQGERQVSKTVHRETPKTNVTGGERHAYPSLCREPSHSTPRSGCGGSRMRRRIAAATDVTLGTSSVRIVNAASPASLIGEVYQAGSQKSGRFERLFRLE